MTTHESAVSRHQFDDDFSIPPEHHDRDITIQWNASDEPEPVRIEQFDFDCLDSFEARLMEEIRQNGHGKRLLSAWRKYHENELRREGMLAVVALLWPTKKTFLALRQLAFAAGLSILAGQTGPELAKECGVSKQDFKQGADGFREKLRLRRTRTMRLPEGCEKMRLTNWRHEEGH